jgi:spore coat protein A
MKGYKRFLWVTVTALLVSAFGFTFFDNRIAAQGGTPSPDQVPLPPAQIPMFAHELPIPRTFAPTVIRNRSGNVIRHEYTISVAETRVQMLPPGLPMTTVHAYGGPVKIPGSSQTQFLRTVPGPIFDNTRSIPSLVRWRNEIFGPNFMPVDPTLHWANPQNMERPTAPFIPFPPGYANAQYPVPFVTHNHGLVVNTEMDGIAEQWFTPYEHRGPSFTTRDYLKPNEQPSTMLFYHDHTMGTTRLGVYAGLVGTAYMIRDPNNPLDQASSPLPKGQYEIPLVLFNRAFFTDGELNFPRVSTNPDNAYWVAGDVSDVALVNGKVWPNLNVERRQYRFRLLAADNGALYNINIDNNGTLVPFTIIGSDGGYLPAPQVVQNVSIGITERADILVDFSQFAAGTQIILRNANEDPTDPLNTLMRFTVQNTPAVTPPVLSASLFPPRPQLIPNAPLRIKTMHNHIDANGNAQRSMDGLDFTIPPTEFPLVGSTEQWDILNLGGGAHQIHLHLIEFQLLNRQAINTAAYLQRWDLLNGHRPVTRPIVVDPAPFLVGNPIPPTPYETGWKDTLRVGGNQVMRLTARWAPQEIATGGATPGVNQFPINPVNPTTSDWYVWHCHVLGHEDNDMMRKLPLVNAWAPNRNYVAGTVIAHQNINYRVRVAHTSQASQQPPARFDRWERVNNNDGTWQPQIIYAIGDRVLHQGLLFRALTVHQAQTGQTPPVNPQLWESIPLNACGQLQQLCHDESNPDAVACHDTGHAGDETQCAANLRTCLAVCDHHNAHPMPCSGICNNPVEFSVADGANFQSGALGTGATCHQTTSQLASGNCTNFTGGRQLTVNGEVQQCNGLNWAQPLPPMRSHGYCIQTTPGNQPFAAFTMF